MANWIQGAIKKPGSFTAAAEKRGESTSELSSNVKANPEKYSPVMRRRAALAKTLAKMRNK
jgi:hypothetical protein